VTHLGSFGAAMRQLDPDAEKDTFEFFGETFTVHGVIPPVVMMQLGAAFTGKIDTHEGNTAMWMAMSSALTVPGDEPDDSQFDRWYKLAAEKRADLPTLIRLTTALFEAQAGRPTGELPASTDGQLATSPSSNGSSSTPPALPGYRPIADVLTG
jgi:hypothetical protein